LNFLFIKEPRKNKILSTLIIISIFFLESANQHYKIIKSNKNIKSEGSCETEDWSKDDENSALPLQK